MLALGVLDEGRSTDLFKADIAKPVRPGEDGPLLLTSGRQRLTTTVSVVAEAIWVGAEAACEQAQQLVEKSRTSTSLAALSQTYAIIEEKEKALAAARDALMSSITFDLESESGYVNDPASAKIAAEVLIRFDQPNLAFDMLRSVDLPRSLLLIFATVAAALGKFDEADRAVDGLSGSLGLSFKGFLEASRGRYRQAVPILRDVLRQEPNDANAAMNLSVCLWELGSHRKAIATALRASRTAPGRRDLSLHYLELLLANQEVHRVADEISGLLLRNVVPDAHLLVIQARVLMAEAQFPRAIQLLERAAKQADAEDFRIEILANLATLRYRIDKISHSKVVRVLEDLLAQSPGHEAVLMCLGRVATRSRDAVQLKRGYSKIASSTAPSRSAFLAHQIAWLDGDNDAAGRAAYEWFTLEPNNPQAAATALVAVGIGQELWSKAALIADFSLRQHPGDLTIVNNSAYIYAMAGRAQEAIQLLAPFQEEFVAKATLGLAYLANDEIDLGMRLYREAAGQAEAVDSSWLCLMTVYQALVVRQLGLDRRESPEILSALALALVPLPDDWEDQPEFLRLRHICLKHGFGWPIGL